MSAAEERSNTEQRDSDEWQTKAMNALPLQQPLSSRGLVAEVVTRIDPTGHNTADQARSDSHCSRSSSISGLGDIQSHRSSAMGRDSQSVAGST